MKKLFLMFCFGALIIAMSSCSGKGAESDPLLGKWEQTISVNGAEAVCTYEFKADDKLEQTFTLKSETPEIDIEGAGTCDYTYADGTITFKFSASDFDFSEFKIEGVPQDNIQMAMDNMKSTMVNVEQKFTDVKIDGDTMTANFKGQQVTLKRL